MSARLLYAVKEAFLTIQGEGRHAGARAVFVRFAGCNVWSGREKDRTRDVSKGCCAAWCDTEFVGTDGIAGGSYSAPDLARLVRTSWSRAGRAIAVFTGGEPSLVVDQRLVDQMHALDVEVHVETNGSRSLPSNVDWVTLSPKPPMRVVEQRYDEVKVVYPAVDPVAWTGMSSIRYVQPLDSKDPATNKANLDASAAFVLEHPDWRLGVQLHKVAGVP